MENSYKSILDFLSIIENDLKRVAPKNTGRLSNSIKAKLVKKTDGIIIEVEMDQYGFYQDQGVNGVGYKQTKSGRADKRYKVNRPVTKSAPFSFKSKMPPPSAFASYTKNKSMQFAIAKSVYALGIKPKNFIAPVVDKATDKLVDLVAQDLFNYFENQIMID